MSGLRKVELVERDADEDNPNKQQVSHVVGVDESGNSADGPFVMTAVQCPREESERLAELLIDLGLQPWKSKSSSSPPGVSNEQLSDKVRRLISKINDMQVTWSAVAGRGSYGAGRAGMIACVVSSKAMTGGIEDEAPEYDGPATIMHDGSPRSNLYGDSQIKIRRGAHRQFSDFPDRYTPVYLSFLRSGDKTYPEITAADYIAGYLNSVISNQTVEKVNHPVQRIDKSWKVSDRDPPVPLYDLRTRDRQRQLTKEDRAAAWIEGRQPLTDDEGWGERSFEGLIDRLESDTVKCYLSNEL